MGVGRLSLLASCWRMLPCKISLGPLRHAGAQAVLGLELAGNPHPLALVLERVPGHAPWAAICSGLVSIKDHLPDHST